MTNISRDRVVYGLGAAVLLLYSILYWSYYAGDAGIHLVYGQNAALGHLFEFNLGEKSSGETSTGYMLLLAFFFQVFPATTVPVIVKLFNYLTWFALLTVFFRLLQDKRFSPFVILVALLTAGLLPGSVYNAVIGMENATFAFLALLWFYLAGKYSYFSLDPLISRSVFIREILFGFSLGLCVWIRPESIPFFLIALATRFFASLTTHRAWVSMLVRTVISLSGFLPPLIALLLFNHIENGTWVPSSVQTRATLERIGYTFGFVTIDFKALLRMVFYAPISLFWLIGIHVTLKKNWQDNVDEVFAIVLFTVFILLFTFAVGAGHLGRYMIFLVPFWVLVAARGLAYTWDVYLQRRRPKIMMMTLLCLGLMLISVYARETYLRFQLGGRGDLLTMIHAPLERQRVSDELYKTLGQPSKLPIVIAFGEVQARYMLDNRFIIRSLDGRVDTAMLKYIHKNYYDYAGYIKERGIDYFVADYANDLPTKTYFSKDNILNMKTGESFTDNGVQFTCVDRSLLKCVSVHDKNDVVFPAKAGIHL